MVYKKSVDEKNVDKCLLCENAPCTKACLKGMKPDRILRALHFDNEIGAAQSLGHMIPCEQCDAACEKACVLNKKDDTVPIRKVIKQIAEDKKQMEVIEERDVDLSMDLCGVKLENPFLLSSSVVASTYDMCARAFEAGWAGASFKTVCLMEQHEASPRFSALKGRDGCFYGFKNIEQLSDHSLEENMEIFRQLKKNYPQKVIVASIMGRNEEEWTYLAQTASKAGADIIECNFSCPNMEQNDLGVTIGQSPELIKRFTNAAKRGSRVPVLAKLTPNVADMIPMAAAAKLGGADGIAAINTVNSITSVNLDSLTSEPSVRGRSSVGGYSGAAVKPIALRFISELACSEELCGLHISGMGGINTWRDALEFIFLGAGSLQITTAVMEYGYRIIDDLLQGITLYLQEKGICELKTLCGSAVDRITDRNQLERDTILFPKFNTEKCIGCGRCVISCRDGGHQAIAFSEESRQPKLIGKQCVGCHLCRLVCPVGAIGTVNKRIMK